MKILYSLILIIFLFFTNSVHSEQKIAFIDMDRVILKSNSGISIYKQLSDLNNKNLKFLKNEEKKFKEKETKLISQKNLISDADFKKKIDELKSEINNYNQQRNKIIVDFKKLKLNSTNKLLKLFNPILVKFSNDKDISIILQKKDLVVAKSQLDITEEIINIVNIKVKEFKIK